MIITEYKQVVLYNPNPISIVSTDIATSYNRDDVGILPIYADGVLHNTVPASGKGTIEGSTYIIDKTTVTESDVVLLLNGDVIANSTTVDGKFKFDYLSTDISFNIAATPTSGAYNTMVIRDVKPVINYSLYKLGVNCTYKKVAQPGYTIKVHVNDNASVPVYALGGAPLGVSIDSTGVISFGDVMGKIDFTVTVSDGTLEQSVSKDISITIKEKELVYINVIDLPLTFNLIDVNTLLPWQSIGVTPVDEQGALFSGGNYITRTQPLSFSGNFYLSCEAIKYNLADDANYYATIFSASDIVTNTTYLTIFGAGHADEGRLVYRVNHGTKIISASKIIENVKFTVKIERVDDVINMYINNVLEVAHTLSPNDIILHNNPFNSVFRIGSNVWDTGTKKGGFGGRIMNFKYGYGP